MIEKVRKVLETHKIQPKGVGIVEKCAGCPWIGWDHVDHLAAAIAKAIK